jgi:hypothetical protein
VREVEHLELALRIRVLELDLEQEPVELGLRKRMDPLVLVRVLRRDHEERVGQPLRLAVDRHLPLLHRLEQRRLRARRRAVDLVREEHVREHDAGHEHRLASSHDHLAGELSRSRVRRELHPLELRTQHVRDRSSEERLRATGRPLDQDVSTGEGGDEQQLDCAILPQDDLLDFLLRLLAQVDHAHVLLLYEQCHGPVLPSPRCLRASQSSQSHRRTQTPRLPFHCAPLS